MNTSENWWQTEVAQLHQQEYSSVMYVARGPMLPQNKGHSYNYMWDTPVAARDHICTTAWQGWEQGPCCHFVCPVQADHMR